VEKQIFDKIEYVLEKNELKEIQIICDKCFNYYVKYSKNGISSFASFITLNVNIPDLTNKYKSTTETKHYCRDCWLLIKENF